MSITQEFSAPAWRQRYQHLGESRHNEQARVEAHALLQAGLYALKLPKGWQILVHERSVTLRDPRNTILVKASTEFKVHVDRRKAGTADWRSVVHECADAQSTLDKALEVLTKRLNKTLPTTAAQPQE